MQKQFTWRGDCATFAKCCEHLHQRFAVIFAEQDDLIDNSGFSKLDGKCTVVGT